MALPRSSTLQRHANNSLAAASYNPHKLALLHTGATLVLLLLLEGSNVLLSNGIEGTGGLSGLGMRSVLTTIQTLVEMLVQIALPFLQAGFLCAAIRIAHREAVGPEDLLGGFRNFHRVLRYKLLETGIYLLIAFACFALINQIFILLPMSNDFFVLLDTITTSSEVTQPMMDALAASYLPALILFCVAYPIIALFFFYQYRMGLYLLLSRGNIGAMAALRGSRMRMRGHRLAMLQLDLSFWWYYLLDAVCTAILLLELILDLLGIALPLDSALISLGTLAVYCLCQLGLYTWMRPKVEVTYIHGFDAIIGSAAYPGD